MNENPTSTSAWKARIDACKRDRRSLVAAWSENIDYRRGKPFNVESDVDRVNVNIDWSLTKAKHAQLFSQVPSVVVTPKNDNAKPQMGAFAQLLNTELTRARVGDAVNESVIDVINASGISVVMVGYEARTEDKDVPAVDALTARMLQVSGQPVPTEKVKRPTSERFYTRRLSPSDLLWPVEFTGSNFDDAPWIGRSGRMFWAEAKTAFKLEDEDKDRILTGTDSRESLRDSMEKDGVDAVVHYDELYYWSHRYHADEKYFKAIRRLVFVAGLEKPVIDEPWNGQEFDPQTGTYIGACRFPIRILTLSYISDDAIPPSDTAIGRPQVQELIRSRSQMLLQRDRSMPIRGYDPTRIDPAVAANLMRGVYQGMVPVKGNGQSAIWEVARANYPQEDYTYDRIAKADLSEQWSLGSNQLGQFASGERSATEAGVIQRNNDSRIGSERARVAAFFVGIAEVMAGLMCLYHDGVQNRALSSEFDYTIRPDSTVLLDAKTRLDQLSYFINLTAKSGLVNVQPVLEEMCALVGLDPAQIIHAPQPAKPEPPAMSLRGEDLINPIAIAMLLKSGIAPNPQELDAAKKLIEASMQPAEPPQPIEGQPPMGEANPNWGPMERITKRTDEVGG